MVFKSSLLIATNFKMFLYFYELLKSNGFIGDSWY